MVILSSVNTTNSARMSLDYRAPCLMFSRNLFRSPMMACMTVSLTPTLLLPGCTFRHTNPSRRLALWRPPHSVRQTYPITFYFSLSLYSFRPSFVFHLLHMSSPSLPPSTPQYTTPNRLPSESFHSEPRGERQTSLCVVG